jgi:sugar phosphate isomerase/epimerase
MPDADVLDWVLWSGTVGMDRPLAERIEAAAEQGFAALSLGPFDVARSETEGVSAAALGASIRERGLEIMMDPLMGWCSDAPLPGPFAAFGFEALFQMAEALRVTAITVFGPFQEGEATPGELVERFGRLCDRAAGIGARVQIEFMPMTTVGDVTAAWSIIQGADRTNGGLVFDTWHFFRGDPDFAALEAVPGDRIFAVQVADAASEVSGSLGEDTFQRRLPGDGVLDLAGAIGTLRRMGGLRAIGPEVISPITASMPAGEAARLGRARVEDLLTATRASGP